MIFDKDWNVDPIGLGGGLSLWQKDEMEVKNLRWDQNLMDNRIEGIKRDMSIRASWCHGNPNLEGRLRLWDQLQEMSTSVDTAWMLS